MVGSGGFEPPKGNPTDLQSVLVDRLSNCPWSWREASNPRPADYKSAALPTELRQHMTTIYILENMPVPLGAPA